MRQGELNIVLDAFWGSCGKGKVVDYLCMKHGVTDVIAGNMPNAGHTVVRDAQKRVLKVLPSGAPFNHGTEVWLGPSSGFYLERLQEESGWVGTRGISIHDRAFFVNDEHAKFERDTLSHVASTMQGSGAALAQKLMRKSRKAIVAEHVDKLPENAYAIESESWRKKLQSAVRYGLALYEVSQGWGLSIDHGTDYPQCTSRNCSAARALDDCGVSPRQIGDVMAVIRPYPIRVGNTEDGHSGGWSKDNAEVTWGHVERVSGLERDSLAEKERTTVTKRVRRVATFSFDLLRDCVRANGVSQIFLNFAQYIDADASGRRGRLEDAPRAIRVFVDAIEESTNTPVVAIGTGADSLDVMERKDYR